MSEQTATQDLPRQAVALFVPRDKPPAVTRHRLNLGDHILLDWLPDGGTPLDFDRLTEVTLAKITLTEAELTPAFGVGAPDLSSVLTVRVELGLLEQLFTTLTGRPPRTPIRFHTGPRPITEASRPWLAKIQALITGLERNPSLAAAPWFQPDIEGWWVAAGLLYAYRHNHSHLLPHTNPAPPIVTPRPPPDGQFIGPLLAHRRHDLGLSQSALADRLTQASGTPITQGRVSDYEHERHIPDDWLPHLSTVLDLPLDQLRRAAELTRTHRQQHQRRACTERPYPSRVKSHGTVIFPKCRPL
jgi:transcriptional regulator with XRE-family HTH domain